MPSKLDRRLLVLLLALAGGMAAAQNASEALDSISAEECAPFGETSAEVMLQSLEGEEDRALASLVIDAIIRKCAALGAIPAPERPGEQGTRSATDFPETSDADRLAAEARYLVETAMQIDPDAANDLLRRLLGPKPVDDG